VANTNGGEVTLAPVIGAEFDGAALPAGWASSVVATGGTTVLGNGAVTVDGASVSATTTYGTGHSVEFVATFTGQANQAAGFGQSNASTQPFAMFAAKSDGQLYARSIATGQALETPIAGTFFNSAHRYRIDWVAGSIVYWIDGTVRVTHTIGTALRTASMRPVFVDPATGGGALAIDWMRMGDYAASGAYTSPVYDAGAATATWLTAAWLADTPLGTAVTLEIQTGNTAVPDATWTPWTAVQSGGTINAVARYAQYRLTLTTSRPNVPPSVKEVVVNIQR
jgi:hypothetical protein